MKQYRNYIAVILLTLILALVAEMNAPKKINWNPSFSKADKIPYGSYALFQVLPQIFPGQSVNTLEQTVYKATERFPTVEADSARLDSTLNYIFVNSSFSPDQYDTGSLLTLADGGASVFVAAQGFSESFADSLHFDYTSTYSFTSEDTARTNFVVPALRRQNPYVLKQGFGGYIISRFDTAHTRILGVDESGRPNFIRIKRGLGAVYINLVPFAFTNYNVLHGDNSEYVFKALSYLPVQRTFWDEYYKDGRLVARSPLRYILSQEGLKWAYYLTLWGVLIFVVVYGRRRQRIIPIVAPPRNSTVEFAETVGRLYFQHGDHHNIAQKKIAYFLEYIRSRFQLKTTVLDDEFQKRVSERSGIPVEDIAALIAQIRALEERTRISESELAGLNGSLEEFYSTSKR